MIINAPCVPHTGHHFMMYRLFPHLPKVSVANYKTLNIDEDILIADHYHMEFMDKWVEVLPKYPTIISLRHPYRNLESYRCRKTGLASDKQFLYQWNNMIDTWMLADELFFFHLDEPELRIQEAEFLRSRFNIPHEIDFSVSEQTGSKHNNHDMEIYENMYPMVPERFLEFHKRSIDHMKLVIMGDLTQCV